MQDVSVSTEFKGGGGGGGFKAWRKQAAITGEKGVEARTYVREDEGRLELGDSSEQPFLECFELSVN